MIIIVIITIVTGILLGFATSASTPTDGFEDLTRNSIVGMAGAFVGLQLAGGVFDSADAGTSVVALTIGAITGAAILLFIVNRVRRA